MSWSASTIASAWSLATVAFVAGCSVVPEPAGQRPPITEDGCVVLVAGASCPGELDEESDDDRPDDL